jgi:hypothetical protein
VAGELSAEGDLVVGEGRQGARIRFAGHFNHCQVRPKVEYREDCGGDGEADASASGYDSYWEFWFRFRYRFLVKHGFIMVVRGV